MAELPLSLRQAISKIKIPEDGGLTIGEAMVEGTCVGASDGSLITDRGRSRGSHGYALRVGNRDLEDIEGWGPSLDSDDMTSMTTEHYRLIGIITMIHVICKKYQ